MHMGKSRLQRRAESGLVVDLFCTDTTLGWRVKCRVPVETALEKVALKKWREIWYETGELAGVQPLAPEQKKTLHQILIERLVAVTITFSEVQRNAGLYGRSHTLGMSEWKRLKRHARFDESKILAPEDATERAIEKVRLWPYPASVATCRGEAVTDEQGRPVFRDKAVRVYPHAPLERRRDAKSEARRGSSGGAARRSRD
jgi:predicted alpha/beta hydrolase